MSRDTEFSCEVVRVTEVLPHPNADRLEIIKFATVDGPTAYVVCHTKDALRAGDFATYVGVDCVVPLDRGEFAFLAGHPETKGKETYRIRAARLRGVYSEGLLVAAPNGARLGDERAEDLGITYYAPPAPPERGDRAFSVAEPSGKPGRVDWRRRLISEFGVASLRKAPDHFTLGEQVTITEKVHGSNIRFGWVQRPSVLPSWFRAVLTWLAVTFSSERLTILAGWDWVVGSHRVFKTDNRPWWRKMLSRRDQGHGWYGEDLWCAVAEANGLRERCARFLGIAFYGEVYGLTPTGKKVQDLTYGAAGPRLVVFDALSAATGKRVPTTMLNIFRDGLTSLVRDGLDLDTPPLLHYGPYPGLEAVRAMAEGQSVLCPTQIREGVVVRSEDGSKRGKWVGEGYRLRKEQA